MKKILVLMILAVNLYSGNIKEYLVDCNTNHNKESCYKVGAYYYNKDDRPKFIKYMVTSCQLKNSKACIAMAKSTDGLESERYYRFSCESGDIKSCNQLGDMKLNKKDSDYKASLNLKIMALSSSCNLGDYRRCGLAGLEYYKIENYQEAEKYIGKACVNGYNKLCEDYLNEYKKGTFKDKYYFHKIGVYSCSKGIKKACKKYKEAKK